MNKEDIIYKKLSEDLEKELKELKNKSVNMIEFYKKQLMNRPSIGNLQTRIFWRNRRINNLVAEICEIIPPSNDNFEQMKKDIDFQIQEAIFDNCCLEIIRCMNQKTITTKGIIESWENKFLSLDWNKFKFQERWKK